jgi:hypothetical protein
MPFFKRHLAKSERDFEGVRITELSKHLRKVAIDLCVAFFDEDRNVQSLLWAQRGERTFHRVSAVG